MVFPRMNPGILPLLMQGFSFRVILILIRKEWYYNDNLLDNLRAFYVQ